MLEFVGFIIIKIFKTTYIYFLCIFLLFTTNQLAGKNEKSEAQTGPHEGEGEDEIVKARDLQVLAAWCWPCHPGEQILPHFGDESELRARVSH